MSRHLHLDLVGGVAGDMLLGLWIELGLPLAALNVLPERLGLKEVAVSTERVTRASLAATHAIVTVRGRIEYPANHRHRGEHGSPAGHTDEHEPPHARHLKEMLSLLERAALSERATVVARRAIELLFEAEAQAHGVSPDEVHLHEAGADDALIDIFGTAVALQELQIGSISCSVPLPIGGGRVHCAHGWMPVPTPAVAELLRGIPVEGGPVQHETITPTGAALLRAMVDHFGPAPAMTIDRTGFGAGGRDQALVPNVVRGLLGNSAAGPLQRTVSVLQTALDDMLPQDVPVLIDALLGRGARDAMVTPVMMKKGRPGLLLTVLADTAQARELAEFVLDHSPAMGVRLHQESRLEWDRDIVSVATPWGAVRVKRALDSSGRVRRGQPEFDDCRRAAAQAALTPDQVRRRAQQLFEDDLRRNDEGKDS